MEEKKIQDLTKEFKIHTKKAQECAKQIQQVKKMMDIQEKSSLQRDSESRPLKLHGTKLKRVSPEHPPTPQPRRRITTVKKNIQQKDHEECMCEKCTI